MHILNPSSPFICFFLLDDEVGAATTHYLELDGSGLGFHPDAERDMDLLSELCASATNSQSTTPSISHPSSPTMWGRGKTNQGGGGGGVTSTTPSGLLSTAPSLWAALGRQEQQQQQQQQQQQPPRQRYTTSTHPRQPSSHPHLHQTSPSPLVLAMFNDDEDDDPMVSGEGRQYPGSNFDRESRDIRDNQDHYYDHADEDDDDDDDGLWMSLDQPSIVEVAAEAMRSKQTRAREETR